MDTCIGFVWKSSDVQTTTERMTVPYRIWNCILTDARLRPGAGMILDLDLSFISN